MGPNTHLPPTGAPNELFTTRSVPHRLFTTPHTHTHTTQTKQSPTATNQEQQGAEGEQQEAEGEGGDDACATEDDVAKEQSSGVPETGEEEKEEEPDGSDVDFFEDEPAADEPGVSVTRSKTQPQQQEIQLISPVKAPVDRGNAAALAVLPQPRAGRRADLTAEQMEDL